LSVFSDTAAFNTQVCAIPTPAVPTRLNAERKDWARIALAEELDEFADADNLIDEVDALIDLIYFAAGRLQEMGVDGQRAWDGVQEANLNKIRGELSKRPGSQGHDAIKPEGWTPPSYDWLLEQIGRGSIDSQVRVGLTIKQGLIIDVQTSIGLVTVEGDDGYKQIPISSVQFL
jgi:hypothetical protein